MPKLCHQLIASTAKEMAKESYESAAHDDAWFKENPKRRAWVEARWPYFVDAAREILGQLLAQPGVPESQKKIIHEALTMEYHLRDKQVGAGL